ncbi:MAG: methyl-accepting chemotaxis protein [Spirochaetaceae bacterium]|jgi:methyl-accepting chemotaxis protein|nr:methyl-accepting chemotaxis protein [Spirochaetaceae bacterium]
MALFSNLFHKDIPQDVITPEKKASSGVELSYDALRTALKTSESLALSVLNGVKTLSEVISSANLQKDELERFETLSEESDKALSEIYGITEQMRNFVDTQAGTMNQSVSSIEQLSSSITSVSGDIGKRLAITKGLSEAAIDGNEKVKKVLDVVKELSENMESIKTVISSINAISAQTNMLAMNAAIEAAHAGQAGRGFSVVADEIRNLSEVTRKNAVNITETVKNTMTALNEVRNTVSKASAAMLWIEEEVTKASSSFEAIIQNMRKLEGDGAGMTKIAQGIGATSSDLKTQSGEIITGLKNISEAIHQLIALERHIRETASAIGGSAIHITGFVQDTITYNSQMQAVLDQVVSAADNFEHKDPFPYTTIVLKHLLWLTRVRGILDGTLKGIDVETNHHNCDLGKWIDAQKNKEYGSLPAFGNLDSTHEEMHTIVRDIISQHTRLSGEEKERKYAQLLASSERVVNALTKLRACIR